MRSRLAQFLPLAQAARWLPLLATASCAPGLRFAPACPLVGIPAGADALRTRVLEARITGLSGRCYQIAGDRLRTRLRLSAHAVRDAAAGRDRQAGFFVTVWRGEALLSRRTYPLPIRFPANELQADVASDTVIVTVPSADAQSGAAYRIAIGLTQDGEGTGDGG